MIITHGGLINQSLFVISNSINSPFFSNRHLCYRRSINTSCIELHQQLHTDSDLNFLLHRANTGPFINGAVNLFNQGPDLEVTFPPWVDLLLQYPLSRRGDRVKDNTCADLALQKNGPTAWQKKNTFGKQGANGEIPWGQRGLVIET